MDKIKFSYIRLDCLIITIFFTQGIIFQIIKSKSVDSIITSIGYKFLAIFLMDIFSRVYDSYKKGPSFTPEKVIVDPLKNIYVNWDDLRVELDGHKPKLLNLGVIYLKSKIDSAIKVKLELNWFTERSALPIFKKNVPTNHALYAIVEDYAEKRGLKF